MLAQNIFLVCHRISVISLSVHEMEGIENHGVRTKFQGQTFFRIVEENVSKRSIQWQSEND